MKILITGNLGYVGPGLVKEFRRHHPDTTLIGFDIGFFAKHLTCAAPPARCAILRGCPPIP